MSEKRGTKKPKSPAERLAKKLDVAAVAESPAPWRCGLRKQREAVGLSQAAVCRALSLNQSALSAWECGNHAPSLRLAFRLANFYGISVDELWEPVGEKPGEKPGERPGEPTAQTGINAAEEQDDEEG